MTEEEQRLRAFLESEQEYEKRKRNAPPQMLHPEYINQDSSQSILINGQYDLAHFSVHEYKVIRQAAINSGCKYDSCTGSLKLMNTAYPIVYKPRYVLLEMIVQLYGNSAQQNDILAVALAYAYKGAAFRVPAIERFELYLKKTGKMPLETGLPNFMILSEPLFSNKISELYEKEHIYEKALFYTQNAYKFICKHFKGDWPFYTNRIAALEELIENPKKKRKDRRDEKFERQITEATTKIINLLKVENVL
ncbi:MAG: hypothetical protein LUD27_01965 [Clostridia bacterium]|nr:hypothetical protein [Clostridia bacterium]